MSVREPIAYRRLDTPLHAARATVATAWGCSLAACALIVESPVLLGSLLLAVALGAVAAQVGPQLGRLAVRLAVPLVLLTVIVNVLVSRDGLTVFARLGGWGVLGQVDLTVEAVVYGLVLALRMLVVALAVLLAVCAANPDELLVSFRRISPRSALAAAIGTRLMPVLADDARRLAEAQRCRADGGVRGTRGRAAILRATVGGALERSLDLAAVLEMRGYGSGVRPPARRGPRSRHDFAFAASAAGLLALCIGSSAAGVAGFSAYPLVHVDTGPAVFALALAIPVVALAPFIDRRGIEP